MSDLEELTGLIRAQFITGKIRLPMLPESIHKVRNILNDDEKGSSDITKAIQHDLTLATTVLRIANSSCFNSSGRNINDLSVAIQRLGGKRTFQILVAVSSKLLLQVNNKTLQGIIRKSFQSSQLVAVAAQEIARSLKDPASSQAFFAGLVHDIGTPAIISAHPKDILKLSEEDQNTLLQNLHREVGARALSTWGMDSALQDVASHHGVESIDRPHGKLIDYVDAANYIVAHIDSDSETMVCPAINRLGLSSVKLTSVILDIEDAIEEMSGVMD